MRTLPVLLDDDTGVDDALAILFAVKHPAIEIRAITCVAGNASRFPGAGDDTVIHWARPPLDGDRFAIGHAAAMRQMARCSAVERYP